MVHYLYLLASQAGTQRHHLRPNFGSFHLYSSPDYEIRICTSWTFCADTVGPCPNSAGDPACVLRSNLSLHLLQLGLDSIVADTDANIATDTVTDIAV